MGMEHITRGEILDFARRHIHLQLVISVNLFHIITDFEQGQADINAIAIENPRKAGRNDHRNPRSLNGYRRMLTGGTAAKVAAAHHDIPFLHITRKTLINIHHAVAGQFLGVKSIQVSCGDNDVRINIIPITPNFSF